MKYLVFAALFLVGMLVVAVVSSRSPRMRSLCWTGLVAVISLGASSGVNFVSYEFYRGADRGFEITLVEMFVLGLLLSPALGYQTRRPALNAPMFPPGWWFLAIFIFVSVLGIAQSYVPLFAWFSVWKMLRMLLIFWVVWRAALTEADIDTFATGIRRGLVLGLLIVGVFALKQKFIDGMYRVPATFDHSNTVPLYVNLAAAPLMAWILGDRRIPRAEFFVSFGAVGAGLAAVLFTQSRLGIVLAGLSAFSSVIVANHTVPSRRSRTAMLVFVIASLVGGIMVLDTLIDRFTNAPESSKLARIEFNDAARLMADDRALGVGINNFSRAMTVEGSYRNHVVVMADEEEAGVAHHLYLLTAAETGYIGLVFLLLLFFSNLLVLFRFLIAARQHDLPSSWQFVRALAAAAIIGQGAVHVSGFYEWAWRITPVTVQYFVLAAAFSGIVTRAVSGGLPQTAAQAMKRIHDPRAARMRAVG